MTLNYIRPMLVNTDAWKESDLSYKFSYIEKLLENNIYAGLIRLTGELEAYSWDTTILELKNSFAKKINEHTKLNESFDFSNIASIASSVDIPAHIFRKDAQIKIINPFVAIFEEGPHKFLWSDKKWIALLENTQPKRLSASEILALNNDWRRVSGVLEKCFFNENSLVYSITEGNALLNKIEYNFKDKRWFLNGSEISASKLIESIKTGYYNLDHHKINISILLEASNRFTTLPWFKTIYSNVSEGVNFDIFNGSNSHWVIKNSTGFNKTYSVNERNFKSLVEPILQYSLNENELKCIFNSRESFIQELITKSSIESVSVDYLNESHKVLSQFLNSISIKPVSSRIHRGSSGNIIFNNNIFYKQSKDVTPLSESEISAINLEFLKECAFGNESSLETLANAKEISIEGVPYKWILFESDNSYSVTVFDGIKNKTWFTTVTNKSAIYDLIAKSFNTVLNESQQITLNDTSVSETKFKNLKLVKCFSPIKVINNGYIFSLNENFYKIENSNVTSAFPSEIKSLPASFIEATKGMHLISKLNEGIRFTDLAIIKSDGIFVGKDFSIKLNENDNLFNNYNSNNLQLVKAIYENYNNIAELPFVTRILTDVSNYFIDVISHDNRYWIITNDLNENYKAISQPLSKIEFKNRLTKDLAINNYPEILNHFELVNEHISKLPSFNKDSYRENLFNGNLGLVESVNRLKHKSILTNPQLYSIVLQISSGQWQSAEYMLLENWITALQPFEYDNDVKDEIEYFTNIKNSFNTELLILENLFNVQQGSQGEFYRDWSNSITNALKENLSITDMLAINKNWEFNPLIKEFSNKLLSIKQNLNNSELIIANTQNQLQIEPVIAPVEVNSNDLNESFIYIDKQVYSFNESDSSLKIVTDSQKLSPGFIKICKILMSNSFNINENSILYSNGNSKIELLFESSSILINGKEFKSDIYKNIIESGVINVSQIEVAKSLEFLFENLNYFANIKWAKNIISKLHENHSLLVFKTSNTLYFNRKDTFNKLYEFKATTAKSLTNNIKQWFNLDISESLTEFLISENYQVNEIDEKIKQLLSEKVLWENRLSKVKLAIESDSRLLESTEVTDLQKSISDELTRISSEIKKLEFQKKVLFEGALFKPGDQVRDLLTGKIGQVQSINGSLRTISVLFGSDVVNCNLYELEPLQIDITRNREIEDGIFNYMQALNPEEYVTVTVDKDGALKENLNTNQVINTEPAYVKGKILYGFNGINPSTPVLINALDYTSLGTDDSIRILIGDTETTTAKSNLILDFDNNTNIQTNNSVNVNLEKKIEELISELNTSTNIKDQFEKSELINRLIDIQQRIKGF